MPSTAPAVKAAIVRILRELNPPPAHPLAPDTAQVLYGTRASQMRRTVIGVRGIVTEVDRPTMGNPVRSRGESHVVTVTASVFRPGSDQEDPTEEAYRLIDAFAEHLRTGTNPTLGINPSVDAWVSGYELDEHTDDEELAAAGRYADVTATVQVNAYRI